jgi:hypothetical protein
MSSRFRRPVVGVGFPETQHSSAALESLRCRCPWRSAGRRAARLALAGVLSAGLARPAVADQVTDTLQQAETAYDQKNFSAALTALSTATTLIRQMKAELWKTMLPEPPPGWTADPAKVLTVGPVVFGGGTSTERHYRRQGASVDVSLVADSPALQSIAGLLGAGMLLGSAELLVINGERVAYNADDNTLQAIVADKVLVKVQGSTGVDKPTLEDFFKAIKLADIAKTAQ